MAQPMSATAKPKAPSEAPLTPLSGMPRRIGRELTMLVIAGISALALQVAIDMGLGEGTNTTTVALPVTIFAVSLAAWGVTRTFASYADPLLVAIPVMLTGISIVFIRRLDRSAAEPIDADAGMFAGAGGRQLIYYIAGVLLFAVFLALVRDHRMMRGYAYILLFAGIALAALPGFLPASISEVNGSKNWVRLGPVSVQPSEFAKLMLLVFFAVYLIRKRDVLSVAGPKLLGLQFPRMKDLFPIGVVWAASMLMLVFERDLGTSLLLFSMFLSMLYMATRRVSWILIGLSLFIGGCIAIYPFFDHLQLRVRIWLDPFHPDLIYGDSFQLVQGLIAMNDGGMLGNGPGMGNPNIISYAESDFILAALGEELGMFGLIALLVLYAVFVQRGFKTALMSRDLFGKLVAGGLAFLVAFQLFVICGGVTGLIPLTGQTTAFLSSGGSSLAGSWLLAAMLVRVSHDARKPWQVSYGLQKTEAPPEFLAEQAARRAAEEAAKADDGPVPGGDQPTELIIPDALQGGQGPAPQSPPERTSSGPGGPMSPPPTSPPPSPPTSPPTSPAGPPQTPPPGPPPRPPQAPPERPGSAFDYRPPQPPGRYGPDRKEGDQ